MAKQNAYAVKGTWHETCKSNGQCPLWFNRDKEDFCFSLQTWSIEEGHIQGIDMKGILVVTMHSGVGPTVADLVKGPENAAQYVSDNASEEQRKTLEVFCRNHFLTEWCRNYLGVKFVKINYSHDKEKGTYHMSMPFGEEKLTLVMGGDGKTPVRIENLIYPFNTIFSNYRICTGEWRYNDYGLNESYRNASGVTCNFDYHGEDVESDTVLKVGASESIDGTIQPKK